MNIFHIFSRETSLLVKIFNRHFMMTRQQVAHSCYSVQSGI